MVVEPITLSRRQETSLHRRKEGKQIAEHRPNPPSNLRRPNLEHPWKRESILVMLLSIHLPLDLEQNSIQILNRFWRGRLVKLRLGCILVGKLKGNRRKLWKTWLPLQRERRSLSVRCSTCTMGAIFIFLPVAFNPNFESVTERVLCVASGIIPVHSVYLHTVLARYLTCIFSSFFATGVDQTSSARLWLLQACLSAHLPCS